PVRSEDGRAALVSWQVRGDPEGAAARVAPMLEATAAVDAAHPELSVAQVGGGSLDKALDDTIGENFQQAERLSVPVTLAVLVLAFGALIAAGIPVLLALSFVAASMGLIGLTSHWIPTTDEAASVTL